MAPDRMVTAGHVLKSVMEVERRGSRRILSEWEAREPDLTEYMLESLTALHHKLVGAGLSHAQARRLYRKAETILLVSIMALRRAQREAWGDGDDEPPAPPLPPSEPSHPAE